MMKIIIAEDEPRALRGLKNLITSVSPDYRVVGEAPDGRAALELMQQIHPDVVFTDLKMPYMDGMALIRAAKAMELEAEFVLVTAYEDFEVARASISLGVFDYLVKPITVDDAKRVLKRLSAKYSGTRQKAEEAIQIQERYPDAHPLVRKTLNIIREGYASKLNQGEIAQQLGITQEYLSYIFNKDTGEPFSKFLKRYRIELAKQFLKDKSMSKDEVAYRVGFSDPKYFGKVFREMTGMCVTEYLKGN